VRFVRRASPEVAVLVGGRAIVDLEHARSFGADAYSGRSADELVRVLAATL
jgi:hypothetical protein